MKKLFFILVMLLPGSARATITLVQTPNTNIVVAGGTSTASQAYGSSNGAGHTLLALVGWQSSIATATVPTLSIADNNSNSWISDQLTHCMAAQDVNGVMRKLCFFYVLSSNAGANTVTGTSSFNGDVVALTIFEISGLLNTTELLDGFGFATSTSSPLPNVNTYVSSSATDLCLSFAYHNNSNAGTWGTSGGWTNLVTANGASSIQVAVWDQNPVSGASCSNTITNSGTVFGLLGGVLALRSVVSRGVLQVQCVGSVTATSTSVTLANPVQAGSTLYAFPGAASEDGDSGSFPFLPSVTDNHGAVYSPSPWMASPSAPQYTSPNSVGGSTTVTASSSSSQVWPFFCVAEVYGAAASSPVYGATGFLNSTGGTTSTSGSLSLPSGQEYVLLSFVDNISGSTVYTGAAGWTNRLTTGSYTEFDQVVAPSTPTSYVSNPTASSAIGNISLNTLTAFSSLSATQPRAVQSTVGGDGHPSTPARPFYGPLSSGQIVLVYAGASAVPSTPFSFSDSQGNSPTLVQGGGSTSHALWMYHPTSGNDTITISCPGVECSWNATAFTGFSGIDVSNAGWNNSASSISDGGITTTQPNDLVLSYGGVSVHHFWLSITNSLNWSWRAQYSSENSATFTLEQLEASTGTFTNTWSNSAGPSPMGAAIVALEPGSFLHPVPPPTQIIGKVVF